MVVAMRHTVTYSGLIDQIVIVLKAALYSSGYAERSQVVILRTRHTVRLAL